MIFEYLFVFLVFIGSSWMIFYETKKSERQKWWIDIAFFILIGLFSLVLSNLSDKLWILYLLIPETVLFISGLMKDMRKIGTLTNFLIQLVAFIFVYFFINIGISNLKDPFIDKSISLGFLSLFITLIWMFIITNSLAITGKVKGLLPAISLISAFVLLMTSSNVLSVSLLFTAFLAIFTVSFVQNMRSDNNVILGTSISQVFGFIFAVLAIKGASLSATSVVLFIPVVFFIMLTLQKIYSFFKHDRKMFARTFLTPENIQSKLINLGFSEKTFVLMSLILTLLLSIFDMIFRRNPQLVAIAIYVITAVIFFSALRLLIFIRDYKDGYRKGKSRIYVVNQYYHNDNTATGEVLKDLCEGLAQNDYDVMVLASKSSFSDPKTEIINGVYVERLCAIPKGNSLITKARGYAKYFFWVSFRFLKVKRNSTILVLTTPPLVAIIPVLWKPFKEFKIVYSLQDLYPDVLNVLQMTSKTSTIYKILKKVEGTILSKSDYIVPVGNGIKRKIIQDYAVNEKKILVIENRALKAHREYAAKIMKTSTSDVNREKEFIVQYAGNLGRVHEFQTVLEAIRISNEEKIKDIKFQFIGGGFNYDKLKSTVEKQKIKQVEFLPYVSPKEVIDFLVRSDLQLVISKKDLLSTAFPSKFYGIVAVGKPMIYICDGEDDIIEYIRKYKFGFTIPNGHGKELFEKIIMLKRSPDLLKEFSINALNLNRSMNYERDVLKKYETLFDRLNSPNYAWKPVEEIFATGDNNFGTF